MSKGSSSELGMAVSALIGVALLVAIVYWLTVARFATVAEGSGAPEEIAARLAPVGEVKVSGAAAPTPAAVAVAPTTAEAASPAPPVYTQSCAACHGTGAAGAPKLGDAAAWGPRIAQGMDQLMHTVMNGKGAMPPRGTCMTCSEEDLKAAVEYMVSQVP